MGQNFFFLKGNLFCNAKWIVKWSGIFQSSKQICHFPIRQESLGWWWVPLDEARSLKRGASSSMICPFCLLLPLHAVLSNYTQPLLLHKVHMLLHHQAFEHTIYGLTFPLSLGWLLGQNFLIVKKFSIHNNTKSKKYIKNNNNNKVAMEMFQNNFRYIHVFH